MAARRTKSPDAPRKTGRPQIYTDALARKICNHIADGKSLRTIEKLPGMPTRQTMRKWLDETQTTTFRSTFLTRYARARQEAADTLAEQCLQIADDNSRDERTMVNDRGQLVTVIDHDNVQRSRLRFDARRWYASKLNPKKYGDRVVQEVTGAGGGPIQSVSLVADVSARLDAIRLRLRGAQLVHQVPGPVGEEPEKA